MQKMRNELYLIEDLKGSSDCRYYAEHGELGGVPNAIGYDVPAHARKFRTEDDALNFIRTDLPEWGREHHRPVGISGFIWDFPGLTALLDQGIDIPDEMLLPTAGRLRLWMC